MRGLSRSVIDYTNLDELRSLLNDVKPRFLINAAGYTGKPNVDACELNVGEQERLDVASTVRTQTSAHLKTENEEKIR